MTVMESRKNRVRASCGFTYGTSSPTETTARPHRRWACWTLARSRPVKTGAFDWTRSAPSTDASTIASSAAPITRSPHVSMLASTPSNPENSKSAPK